MDRFVCIHGHFYQPPRENPWLEVIEVQDSAYPYHDWNQRITAECYAANAASRIHDGRGRIARIVNNYAKISFNFGPTLLSWMELNQPETYQAILEADQESQKKFSGHGSALAQVYNHLIMPLANPRDRRTQVIWGIRDFERRFGRKPEGMWLSETAVDLASLELLAEQGIGFTILAPHQAGRVRKIGGRDWEEVTGARIDPSRAYRAVLPSGRSIALFFYDGPTSRAVAFEQLLARGDAFANRLASVFSDQKPGPQFSHIATDGETYGHHHRFGDMALAYALEHLEAHGMARLTNYGEFLERHPPTHKVEIIENTSWSCAHGVERWRSDCGCSTGAHPGWNQAWRKPLREALDFLRDRIAPDFEQAAAEIFHDPWAARDDYISLVLDRSPASRDEFFSRNARPGIPPERQVRALKLLELQRHAMLMFTSCGWFFDDVGGIETVQVLCYASRVIQLARELFNEDLEPEFLTGLEKAKSNQPECRDGRAIYENRVRPSIVNLAQVAAHFAVSSVFEDYEQAASIYCYDIEVEDYQKEPAGKARLVTGRARVSSRITGEAEAVGFGVLHLGDHNLTAKVNNRLSASEYQAAVQDLQRAFRRADFPEVIRRLDRRFDGADCSLKNLFRDQQRKILSEIMEAAMSEGEAFCRQFYELNAPIMRFLLDLNAPLPKAFRSAAELIINLDLSRLFRQERINLERARALLTQAEQMKLELDRAGLGFALGRAVDDLADRLGHEPASPERLSELIELVGFARSTRFELNHWRAQTVFWRVLRESYPLIREQARGGDELMNLVALRLAELGELLMVQVE